MLIENPMRVDDVRSTKDINSKMLTFLAALRTARCHLKSRRLLIFDVWYGQQCFAQRPTTKLKLFNKAAKKSYEQLQAIWIFVARFAL